MAAKVTTKKVPDLIFDVGLHHGQDTDFYLKNGYRVVAFEADPRNADHCRRRFADAIADGRLTIIEGAIADPRSVDHDGRVTFFRNEDHTLWGSTSEDWASRNLVMGTTNERISVNATDLGKVMEEYGVPFYLKADIVGSEMVCLDAMRRFVEKPSYLSIRSEKIIFTRLEAEFDLLEELGYNGFKAVKQDFERIKPLIPDGNGGRAYTFEEGASGPFGEATRGKWRSREEVLNEYRRVFIRYWLFGDYSYLIQTERGKRFIATMERVFRRSIPGWYDTHARHSSLDSANSDD